MFLIFVVLSFDLVDYFMRFSVGQNLIFTPLLTMQKCNDEARCKMDECL